MSQGAESHSVPNSPNPTAHGNYQNGDFESHFLLPESELLHSLPEDIPLEHLRKSFSVDTLLTDFHRAGLHSASPFTPGQAVAASAADGKTVDQGTYRAEASGRTFSEISEISEISREHGPEASMAAAPATVAVAPPPLSESMILGPGFSMPFANSDVANGFAKGESARLAQAEFANSFYESGKKASHKSSAGSAVAASPSADVATADVARISAQRDAVFRGFEITEPARDDKETGEKDKYMTSILDAYQKLLEERSKYHFGYPYNLDFDYGALAGLQHFSINNLGDPFIESNYGVHSRPFEVGVLNWFARLWDIDEGDYWGYITNCGTEGNLHGILVGREVLPDGVLYASRESHYSVFKAARMYRMECEKVATHTAGDIDCRDLAAKLAKHRGRPAILNVNIGTTVKGAVDDLDLVIKTLHEAGLSDDQFYIHCDGALFGLMLPFVKKAPRVTFKKPIGSVSVSGHKFVGCPMPCGVQITRRHFVSSLSSDIEYLASRDATIMGSRNGHAPIFLWYTLNKKGYRGFRKDVQRCLRNALYLHARLRAAGFGAMLNTLSSTVVFERPEEEGFVRRWQLACQGKVAHAVVMPSVSHDKIDSFVEEFVASRERCRRARVAAAGGAAAAGAANAPAGVSGGGGAAAANGSAATSTDALISDVCVADVLGPENCSCADHIAIWRTRVEQNAERRRYSCYSDASGDDSSSHGGSAVQRLLQ
ncbi:hypothetical protein CLOM_g7891 [Closterium sp. NIES-68]|nr:hypothetical protein CLOM_g7891 [Closterium sp. NIES-68]GJP58223.1 hypothetical protein CLOP_g22692 [Closterium sp. NIES-67]